ncbi:MAG: HAMP domain-containing protein, partial [Bryobacteraceae bacterium]|nr:HAMP domain-containing protein [Bryobacteraceae bacterium]
MPVMFLVFFSVSILNLNLNKWFSRPAEKITFNLVEITKAIDRESQLKAKAQADWLASLPEVAQAIHGSSTASLQQICAQNSISDVRVVRADGSFYQLCKPSNFASQGRGIAIQVPLSVAGHKAATLSVRSQTPLDLERTQHEIADWVHKHHQIAADRKSIRWSYLQLLALITLFILFVATWTALFLAKQISIPIAALLGAAQEIRKGNLGYRISVGANDELANLVRAFNEMARELEANSKELESRRRFTEAILESIPTGVISLSSDGRIQKVNRALKGLFSAELVDKATRLEHLLPPEEAAEIRYVMNRARRTGLAATQLELKNEHKVLHLSATVAALDDQVTSGLVLVLEDTSDLLRAHKASAWHEVARRVAHEIKNPLTPIALCAGRIQRHLDRGTRTAETDRVLRECSATIAAEVETVKTLIDEFSQFARFPAAQLVPSDLNEIVENALGVFTGRLDGIELQKHLARNLPMVNIDREQFKRLVVNLVDNAAEAMEDSLLKRLYIETVATSPETIEL